MKIKAEVIRLVPNLEDAS